MSTLENARSSSNVASRAGLARFRQLQEQDTKNNSVQSNLPNGWFYNETKQDQFWEDIENQNSKYVESVTREGQQQRTFNDIETSTHRVSALLADFDSIDQDTLIELMQIIEHDDNIGDIDQISIIDDAKNNVLLNIDELKEFAESQSTLMDSIKEWLAEAQSTIRIETKDPISNEELPSVDNVFDKLSEVLRSYVERSEKAAFLHTDVSDFWAKQNAQLKKIIYARDEEIRSLQAAIQAAQAARQKKISQKKAKTNSNDSEKISQQSQQIDKQLRLIAEQKAQIEKLKNQLQITESEKIVAQINSPLSKNQNPNNINSNALVSNLETETKISYLNQRVSELNETIIQLKQNVASEKDKNHSLTKKLTEKEKTVGEMELLLNKYLNQLSLERSKNKEVQPKQDDSEKVDKEELYILQMKFQQEIKDMKANHAQELVNQAEILEERFEKEKNLLLESIESSDTKDLVRLLIDEYDKKFEKTKEEYNKSVENLKMSWTSKLSLLTTQYETRINNLNSSHEIELINTKDSINYEIKKVEMDLAENFNKEILQMKTDQTNKLNDLNNELDSKNDEITSLTKEVEMLKQKVKLYEPDEHNETLEMVPDEKEEKENEQMNPEEELNEKKQEDMQTERFARRYNTLKANLDEQHEWDLKMQKEFHDHKLYKTITEYQQPIRSLLLDMQEAILNADEMSQQDTYDVMAEKISQAFITLNKKFEQTEQSSENDTFSNEEKVSLADAQKRNKILTERIVSLTNQLDDLKESQDNQSSIPELEKTIEKLKSKIKMLESIQNDDQKLLAKQIDEMEAKYKDEIQFKDELISELQDALLNSNKKSFEQSENMVVFDFDGDIYEDYDDYEEDTLPYRQQTTNLSSQSSMYVKKDTPIFGNIPASQSTLNTLVVFESIQQPNNLLQPPLSPKTESPNKANNLPKKNVMPIQTIQQKHHFQASKKPTNAKSRRGNLYDVETQISSAEPIVEQALKSILDRLSYRRCDSFSLCDGQMEFKDSNSIPKYTTRLPKTSIFRPTGFKVKLYCSPIQAIHRNDNFISFPITSEPLIELDNFPSIGTPITTEIDSSREQNESEQNSAINSTKTESGKLVNSIIVETLQSEPPTSPGMASNNGEPQKGMKRSRYILCSIPPKPKEPIVIAVNEDQMKTITQLQNQLKEINKDSQKRFLLDISTEASNHLINSLNTKEARIKELESRPPEVVYEPTIVTLDDRRPDPLSPLIIPESRSKYSLNGNDIPNGPTTRPYSSRKREDFSPKSLHYQKMRHHSTDFPSNALHHFQQVDEPNSETETPSPTREPIQFIEPPEEDLVDAKAIDDPFSAAVQSAISNMRFMAQIRDNTNETLETLKNDYLAYEAYLTALKIFDDNDASFIENLKDVKSSIEKILLSYDLFAKKQKNLLDIVRYSRKKANYMANLYNNLKSKVADEQLVSQSQTLSNVTNNDSPLKIFEEIGTVLNVLEKLDIDFSIDNTQQFEELKRSYRRNKPKSDKDKVDKQIADKLLMKTKEFIEGLRNKQEVQIEQSEIVANISRSEVKSLKHKLKKSLEINENLKKDLYRAQEENSNQKDTIASLRNDLKSEKEQNDQTLTMYQAQIQTLRDLLNELDDRSENGKAKSFSTSTEMLTKIKKEVLNMQQLLDAQTIELKDARSTLSKMKETIRQNEYTITHLKRDLEESELKYLEIDDKLRKYKEESLFNEADQISKEQEDDDNDDIKKMQRRQIEQAQADQKLLANRIHELEEKLIKIKKRLNEVVDENDELKFKFALRQYEVQSSIEKSSKETQTVLRILNKKSRNSSPSRNESKAQLETKTPPNDNKTNEIKSTSPEPRVQLKFDPSTQNSTSEYLLNSSYILLLEEEEDGDVYIDNEVLIMDNQIEDDSPKVVESDDKFINVHSPLDYKNRKNSTKDKTIFYMLNDPRNKRPVKLQPKNPKVFIPKAIADQSLSIGFDEKHPYRATSSMSSDRNRGRPYQSTVTPVNYASLLKKPIQDLSISAIRINTPDVNSRGCETSKSLNGRGLPTKKPTTSRSTSNQPYIFEGGNGNVESLRITNIQFTDNSNVIQNTPIVQRPSTSFSRISRTSAQSQNSAIKAQKTIKSTEDEEIKFLLTSLRSKVKKLLASNEKKDETILNLNRRISELTLVLNRSKIDNIRLTDFANRMKLRFENINQRLSAAVGELAVRHDENSALRRQLIHLKHAAIPTMPLLRRMHKAKEEQERIDFEQDQAKSKLENTKQIAKKATDDVVRQHLNTMIKNSQQSILRMEARRKYWQEVERKQMISVLSAISLISQDIPEIQQLQLPYSSPFRTMKSGKNTPVVQKRTQTYVNYVNKNQDGELGELEVTSLNKPKTEIKEENVDDNDIDIEIKYEPLSRQIVDAIRKPSSNIETPIESPKNDSQDESKEVPNES